MLYSAHFIGMVCLVLALCLILVVATRAAERGRETQQALLCPTHQLAFLMRSTFCNHH